MKVGIAEEHPSGAKACHLSSAICRTAEAVSLPISDFHHSLLAMDLRDGIQSGIIAEQKEIRRKCELV